MDDHSSFSAFSGDLYLCCVLCAALDAANDKCSLVVEKIKAARSTLHQHAWKDRAYSTVLWTHPFSSANRSKHPQMAHRCSLAGEAVAVFLLNIADDLLQVLLKEPQGRCLLSSVVLTWSGTNKNISYFGAFEHSPLPLTTSVFY